MLVSQRAQYAVRAVFELARRADQEWVKISDIAETQAIPVRFLEVILNQLKQAGFVASKRGSEGGYHLARSASDLTVGEVLQFVDGPYGPVECLVGGPGERCPLHGNCSFLGLWEKARKAVSQVYDKTTFLSLVEEEAARRQKQVLNFTI